MIKKESVDFSSFRCVEIPDEKVSSRVTSREISIYVDMSASLSKKISYEKQHLAEVQGLKSTEMAGEIADRCQIAEDTLKKAISGKVPATRRFLYKFTVGLQMPLEKANEFFVLCGGALSDDCAADYICKCALRDKDDIWTFLEEMEQYLGINLYLRERKDEK